MASSAAKRTKRSKRKGKTVTFSVSVDVRTREQLQRVALDAYRGNVSELITQIAGQAARQNAARQLLALHGVSPWSEEECATFLAEIEAELSAQEVPKRPRRRVA